MAGRGNDKKKNQGRRRRAVAAALLTLRKAIRRRSDLATDRIKVARAYRVLGDTARAASWYRSAVDALAARGEPVKALALAKEMTEVIPQERRTFTDLAARFASAAPREESLRTRVARPVATPPEPPGGMSPSRVLDATELLKVHEAEELGVSEQPLPEGTLLPSLVPPDVLSELHDRGEIDLFDEEGKRLAHPDDEAVEVEAFEEFDEAEEVHDFEELRVTGETEAVEVEELEDHEVARLVDEEEVIDTLARVPLFSDLDRSAFVELAREVHLRTVPDREYVFREGEPASSFFLVAEGAFEVVRRLPGRKREIVLHQFRQGEAFGIFGLFAGQMRAASARAIGNAEVLEVPGAALSQVVSGHPAARNAVSRFYKERLLENFLASSPIFDSLDAVARGLLIGQFRERRFPSGARVVSPGEVFNGLFLVIDGELQVSKRLGAARDEILARLTKGQFFGVVSALSGTPCRVQIVATADTMLTLLPQRAFNEFVKDYPTLRLLPQRLSQEGLLVEKDVFVGGTGIPGLA